MERQATFGPNTVLPGTPYVLVQKIGSGAMGDVYEAFHTQHRQTVALKVMATRHIARADLTDRMKNEAATLGRIKHANLVALFDTGFAADGRLYFAMELLRGHTLRRTIDANAPVRPELAVELVTELLAGLHAAHRADVVHRDIKPENVFVCASGEVKVLDFGVAKVGQLAASLTQAGLQLGTPRYMSPEQIEGKPVSFASDLYAVGIVLYELLTRRVPFEDEEPMALAFAHATRPPPSPSSFLQSPLPPRLEAAVLRALAKSPAQRFASARAFAEELAASLHDTTAPSSLQRTQRMDVVSLPAPEPVLALSRPYSTPPKAARRSRLGLVVAAVLLLVAVTSVIFLAGRKHRATVSVAATSSVPIPSAPSTATSAPAMLATSSVALGPPPSSSAAPTTTAPKPVVIVPPKPSTAPIATTTSRRPGSGL